MTSGSMTNAIAIQLQQMLRTINNRLLISLGSPTPVAQHEMAGNALVRDLENWQRQLDLFQRRLRQVDHQLAARESRVHDVPRSHRFRERQSIGSGRDSLEQAERLATEVRGRLDHLFRRTVMPEIDTINKGFDQLVDTAKEFKELQDFIDKAAQSGRLTRHDASAMKTVVSERGAEYHNHVTTQPAGPDWLVLLTLTIRLVHMAVLARKNK